MQTRNQHWTVWIIFETEIFRNYIILLWC